MKRRDFLKSTAVIVTGASVSLSTLDFIDPKEVLAANPDLRWGFLVDTHKCVGCGFCVKACKIENDIPYNANVTRTWEFSYRASFDLVAGRINRQEYSLHRDLHCWKLEFTRIISNIDQQFGFRLYLLGMPDLKLTRGRDDLLGSATSGIGGALF